MLLYFIVVVDNFIYSFCKNTNVPSLHFSQRVLRSSFSLLLHHPALSSPFLSVFFVVVVDDESLSLSQSPLLYHFFTHLRRLWNPHARGLAERSQQRTCAADQAVTQNAVVNTNLCSHSTRRSRQHGSSC